MTKQHVGAQSDAIEADPALEAARAAQRAALAAIRPQARKQVYSIGDGDRCPIPINESCGKMFVIGKRQYCPNQAHDNVSRAWWPYDHLSEAVKAYHGTKPAGEAAPQPVLPDLDIDLGGL
jgi:hypothetical protein